SSLSRQRPCTAPKTNNLSLTIGPPIPPPNWFCVYAADSDESPAPQASDWSRNVYVNEPSGTLVPPRVVDATRPPLNSPRATSYVLVMTCVDRSASSATALWPDRMLRPSCVSAFAVGRSPSP